MPFYNLIDITTVNKNIVLDIRYATPNNFLGFPLYSHSVCYVHKNLIQALNLIQKDLEKLHLGLKIYDGYRPLSVQQMMWEKVQDERYVSNPAKIKGSHPRGAAVDVTLLDHQGNELEMPSEFDEFTERAHLNYMETSQAAIHHRELLQNIMKKYGFEGIDSEWWHFHVEGWKDEERYPALDISFEELISQTPHFTTCQQH